MKVVLLADVDKIGEANEVINASEGYARNFLFPRKLAVAATPSALIAVKKRQAKKDEELEAKRSEFESLANKLSTTPVTISADAGEGGKLFGSVTAQDIAIAVGAGLDKRRLELKEPIKSLGEYEVPFKLYKEIGGKIKVNVVPKGEA